jgi:hypothetical protein
MKSLEFPYSQSKLFPSLGEGLPFVPITVTLAEQVITVSALADSGSTINVLPYNVGIQLGLIWEEQKFQLPPLIGILRDFPAFGILLNGKVDPFPPVPLAFAWTKSNDVPVILGQTNFFSEFDIYFFGSQKLFSIIPKQQIDKKENMV